MSRGAYVLRVLSGGNKTSMRFECAELPQELHATVDKAFQQHHSRPAWLSAALLGISVEHEIPGFALEWADADYPALEIPDPFDVCFEPTLLDERSEALESLCTGLIEWQKRRAPATNRVRRHFIRYGMPPLMALFCGVYFMFDYFGTVPARAFAIGAAFIALIAWVVICMIYARRWLIAPGTVMLAPRTWQPWETIETYTVRDSVLWIRRSFVGWEATLWRGRKSRDRTLTELEAVALLGAWQAQTREEQYDDM